MEAEDAVYLYVGCDWVGARATTPPGLAPLRGRGIAAQIDGCVILRKAESLMGNSANKSYIDEESGEIILRRAIIPREALEWIVSKDTIIVNSNNPDLQESLIIPISALTEVNLKGRWLGDPRLEVRGEGGFKSSFPFGTSDPAIPRMACERISERIEAFKEKRTAGELPPLPTYRPDFRPPEHKSYIDESTGDIVLRANNFSPGKTGGGFDPPVVEWIISGDTITIIEHKHLNKERKIIPLAQLSGVMLKEAEDGAFRAGWICSLELFIGIGRIHISSSVVGSGGSGSSGLANYTLLFHRSDIDVVQKAKEYLTGHSFSTTTGHFSTNASPAAPKAKSIQEITAEIAELQHMLYSGLITEEEFALAKKKLLGI